MSDLRGLKNSIRALDTKDIHEIEGYCKEVAKERYKKKDEESRMSIWKKLSVLPVGTRLYCRASGVFMGGDWQRGDYGIIDSIQPRKKIIWINKTRKSDNQLMSYPFDIYRLQRYTIDTVPPESPLSDRERLSMESMSEVVAKCFSTPDTPGDANDNKEINNG